MYSQTVKQPKPAEWQIMLSILFLSVITLFISSYFDISERFFKWAGLYEHWEADELISVPIALAIGYGFFFWRRSRLLLDEIAQRTALAEQLTYQATHDELTGLPNRKLFLERLDELLEQNGRGTTEIAVLFLDLDNFKIVNDSSGHDAGDSMLVAVTNRLQQALHARAFLARLGGDEFTVLVDKVDGSIQIENLIQTIQIHLVEPIMVGDCAVVVTVSIGVAFASDTDWTSSELLRNADAAMYVAKRKGKSDYEFFEKEMNVKAKTHLSLEAELRQAVRKEQFCAYYQPIFHLQTQQIVGLEALVRWHHPQKGILPPVCFLDMAEKSGLMNEIGNFIFFEACRQVRDWQVAFAYKRPLYLSLNLSPRQLQHPEFVTQTTDMIRQTAFPAHLLHLELIENMAIHNTDVAIGVMKQLQLLGVNIALDDFGAGFSSLAYLSRLPVNSLKMDRSFTWEMEKRPENLSIVRAILALSKAMQLAVTAEGIETASQLATLCALDCPYGQGFFFARPMSATDTGKFLKKQAITTHKFEKELLPC